MTAESLRQMYTVSLACLWLSVKFLEGVCLELDDLRLCVFQFCVTSKEIVSMEMDVLQVLQWRLVEPNPFGLIYHVTSTLILPRIGGQIERCAWSYVAASAAEHSFPSVPLGTLAGAAIICARRYLQLEAPDTELEELCLLLGVTQASGPTHKRAAMGDCG